VLDLGVCILLRVLDQVEGFPSNATLFLVFYYFVQIIRYMFWPYNHLQVEIYALEINMFNININFQCTYFRMKMVVRPKHVADNLNKIVKDY
jgi:hypothetical protein